MKVAKRIAVAAVPCAAVVAMGVSSGTAAMASTTSHTAVVHTAHVNWGPGGGSWGWGPGGGRWDYGFNGGWGWNVRRGWGFNGGWGWGCGGPGHGWGGWNNGGPGWGQGWIGCGPGWGTGWNGGWGW